MFVGMCYGSWRSASVGGYRGFVGALVDRCSKLERLTVFSCTQLTQRFLLGHSREDLVVLGVPTSCL
jgi:hypothetical protein